MKTNPFQVAMTFLMGCCVALLTMNLLQQPVVNAQAAGVGAAPGVSALSFRTAQGEGEMLVVFKQVDKSLVPVEGFWGQPVMAMAVYEITKEGNQKGTISLLASRYIGWDMDIPSFNTGKSNGSGQDVNKWIEELIKQKQAAEKQWDKRNK